VLKESLVLCRVLEDRLQQFQVSFKCLFFVPCSLSLSLSLSLLLVCEKFRENQVGLLGFFSVGCDFDARTFKEGISSV